MAKTAILGGRTVKVENRSGFDKSRLNLLTTGVGTITPIFKQFVIPSSGKIRLAIHAELPPLATDAYLRTHLKVEAFYCPLRLCYGGFQSFFCGETVLSKTNGHVRIENLPIAMIPGSIRTLDDGGQEVTLTSKVDDIWEQFGPSSLTDYFDVKLDKVGGQILLGNEYVSGDADQIVDVFGLRLNLFPYLAYHLIYDHFYRNKSVQKPVFARPVRDDLLSRIFSLSNLPYITFQQLETVVPNPDLISGGVVQNDLYTYMETSSENSALMESTLADGSSVFNLRQRNYGDDYFTAAKPRATEGNPITVQTDENGRFTIASLRLQNALADFADVNNYATPDYQQANLARYGVNISDAIVQKPTLLGSADFPMFTKGIELNSNTAAADSTAGSGNYRNPFSNEGILGATAGRAQANGSEFVCDFDVKEVGYIMVMATLVPEANYNDGIAKDMKYFTQPGSLTDIPCSLLEAVGDEPIMQREVAFDAQNDAVFGFVQRYLWHKIGGVHSIHGLFRSGESLQAFAPQRYVAYINTISSDFLQIPKFALDGVAAVESGVSQYGVMMDCSIDCYVSEPLSESALPSLVDPSKEHGRSVYLKNGGSKLA